jgi:hypothetical protein
MIPGFWLTGQSRDPIVAELKNAGHEPRVLTLPGSASVGDDRSEIGLRDHVNAVIDVVARRTDCATIMT